MTLASTPPIVDSTMHSRGGSRVLAVASATACWAAARRIGGEVAPEPDDDVDRIRREQRERHGVLAEAQDGRHLAGAARAGELDPRVAGAHPSIATWWSTSQALISRPAVGAAPASPASHCAKTVSSALARSTSSL